MKGYYHASSHGMEKNDIFKNRTDFIDGMNDVALCVLGFDVVIVCFCLMSNHFHFVLYGTLDECRKFIDEYKRRCAMRMRRNSGEVQGMRRVGVQIDLIDSQEYLENVIAYVLRNPLAAGVTLMPYHYRWSSASCYFAGEVRPVGRKLAEISERKRCGILKSRASVPDSYIADDEGMIIPACYVSAEIVESIFRHPSRLMMLLAKKIENNVEIQLGVAENVVMTDQEMLTQMNELILKEFQTESISQLSMNQRIKLCLLMKRNFRAGVKQIARLTRLDPTVVAKVI